MTIAGVSLAITLAMIMFSISEGIRVSTDEIIEESGIDILVMPKGSDIFIGTGEFSDSRDLAHRINSSNQQIKGAYPYLRERIYISANTTDSEDGIPKITSILAKGGTREVSEVFGLAKVIEGDYLPTKGDPFYEGGDFIKGPDSINFTREILVNSILAEYLEVGLEDNVYISTELPAAAENYTQWIENTTQFFIKGIMTQSFEDEGEMSATLHLSELQYVTNKLQNDSADTIVIDLYNPSDAEEVKHWLENDFESANEISALTQQDVREEIERFTSTYRGFSEMVAGITILVALLFISTVIMISVKERTGELSAL
ncbi:MAG: ABC transporter permease, partial [Methanomassiliicoccales archaeon]